MQRIATGSPDRLAYRDAEHGMPWIAMLLCLASIVFLVMVFTDAGPLRDLTKLSGDGGVYIIIAGMVLLGSIGWLASRMGGWLGRLTVTLDRGAGTVSVVRGGLGLAGTDRALDAFQRLVIDLLVVTRGSRVVKTTYRLHLDGEDPKQRVMIARSESQPGIMIYGEEVGAFLGLDVHDRSGEEEQVHRAGALGVPLGERAGAIATALPQAPADAATVRRPVDGGVVLDLPRDFSPGCFAVWLVLAIAVVGALAYVFVDSGSGALILLFGPVGMLVLVILYSGPSRTQLTVTGARIEIVRRSLRTTRISIPTTVVREVVVSGRALRISWRGGSWQYGHPGFPEAEAAWVGETIRAVLGGAAGE